MPTTADPHPARRPRSAVVGGVEARPPRRPATRTAALIALVLVPVGLLLVWVGLHGYGRRPGPEPVFIGVVLAVSALVWPIVLRVRDPGARQVWTAVLLLLPGAVYAAFVVLRALSVL